MRRNTQLLLRRVAVGRGAHRGLVGVVARDYTRYPQPSSTVSQVSGIWRNVDSPQGRTEADAAWKDTQRDTLEGRA